MEELLNRSGIYRANVLFTEEFILFGCMNNVKVDVVLDFIILFAKFYIYKSKLQETRPLLEIFLRNLKYRFEIEKYSSFKSGNITKFVELWSPYEELVR